MNFSAEFYWQAMTFFDYFIIKALKNLKLLKIDLEIPVRFLVHLGPFLALGLF